MWWAVRRILISLLLIWIASSIVFLAIRFVPGDPAELLLSQGGIAPDPASVAALREQLGLDGSIGAQYLDSFQRLLQGDLGESLQDGSKVNVEILRRLPRTLELIGVAALLAVGFGVPAGMAAALRRGSPLDRALSAGSSVGLAVPVFVGGTLLVLLFAQTLKWVPAGG